MFKMKSYKMKINVVLYFNINGVNVKVVKSFDGRFIILIIGLYLQKIIEEIYCVKLRRRF